MATISGKNKKLEKQTHLTQKVFDHVKKKTPNPFFEFEYKMIENIRENFRKI